MDIRFFWLWRKFRFLLYPLSLIYRIFLIFWYFYWKLRRPVKLPAFTIVVGNLTVGGTGKTPLVLYLAERLKEKGHRIVILSRGYGRKSKGIKILSKGSVVSVKDVGDEPFLLYKKLKGDVPVVVEKNRLKGSEVALKLFNPDIFILDDAYQYRKIEPDLKILILDPAQIEEGVSLIPSGPWREPLGASKYADLIIFNLKSGEFCDVPDLPHKVKTFRMRYVPQSLINSSGEKFEINSIKGKFFVFSGIADPLSFIDFLKKSGFEITGYEIFMDHHWYTEKDLKRLILKREKSDAHYLLTTEKDMVRIENPLEKLVALEVKIKIEDEDNFWKFIDDRLSLHFSKREKGKSEEN
jgi:tetraacyldisaccharide 4'-kinase